MSGGFGGKGCQTPQGRRGSRPAPPPDPPTPSDRGGGGPRTNGNPKKFPSFTPEKMKNLLHSLTDSSKKKCKSGYPAVHAGIFFAQGSETPLPPLGVQAPPPRSINTLGLAQVCATTPRVGVSFEPLPAQPIFLKKWLFSKPTSASTAEGCAIALPTPKPDPWGEGSVSRQKVKKVVPVGTCC